MSRTLPSNVKAWLTEPMPAEVARAVERIARAPDVQRVAIMPDVHLAADVCVGTVIATHELIYPAAVGGDIGCGIAVIGFEADAHALGEAHVATQLLERLQAEVPVHRHRHNKAPDTLSRHELSDPALRALSRREGAVQFGTLGRGNHFLEFQSDDEGRLWLMVHSGSRAMGQAIRDLHVSRATPAGGGLAFLKADHSEGLAYLADLEWARAYARQNRRAMVDAAAQIVREVLAAGTVEDTYMDCDHNHLRSEPHFGRKFWIHRKGAMSAAEGESGMIPGSMGTESFHVTGRGDADSLCSSSHGAGRQMSRSEARQRIRPAQLERQMKGVWFDPRAAPSLCDEAPSAYKDVRAVLRAESVLTRVVRRLRPVLSYKGV